MEDGGGGLCTLLGHWLQLVEKQREAIQQRVPVEILWELIGAKEELKEEIARALPGNFKEEDSGWASLLGRILEEEKQVQELLAVWLGELRGEISRLHQGQEALQAYFKKKGPPQACFFDKRR